MQLVMSKDAVLIELLSESLNAESLDRRCAAKFLLDSLRAGLPAEDIVEQIQEAEHGSASDFAAHARGLGVRLGVLTKP